MDSHAPAYCNQISRPFGHLTLVLFTPSSPLLLLTTLLLSSGIGVPARPSPLR
ncbi:hypothetical protein K469DRAFT_712838 [Zopfia rhizophila CBS 207.26]|uniref:Uncharacterized protein n=1 Tax=Zopfia rhizophila CBS 207.26 TaxID=1314779 RepID=A0A6A6DRM8_9PEZI|nr:hypothetical protein K469DRAFT_712838 [Zopfia rhizophila CBS 207.26]